MGEVYGYGWSSCQRAASGVAVGDDVCRAGRRALRGHTKPNLQRKEELLTCMDIDSGNVNVRVPNV